MSIIFKKMWMEMELFKPSVYVAHGSFNDSFFQIANSSDAENKLNAGSL